MPYLPPLIVAEICFDNLGVGERILYATLGECSTEVEDGDVIADTGDKAHIVFDVINPAKWSAEQPNLYKVVVVAHDNAPFGVDV